MDKSIEKSVENILKNIDPESIIRLTKTPKRVAASYKEFFSGYDADIEKITKTMYDSDMNEMVILRDIPFESHCEHHIIPIIGKTTIGYIPNGKIIGASKIARIVDCFSHRLQLQERMTIEIANAIDKILQPKGIAIYIEAEHFCISHRGVKKHGAKLVTKYFIGNLKNDQSLRNEFLIECKR